MRREKAHGAVTESLCRFRVRKRSKSQKRERERERERECVCVCVIDCFVNRDSSERRAVIKVNHVFLFLRNVWCRVL